MNNRITNALGLIAFLLIVAGIIGLTALAASAAPDDKVTLCHAAGREGTTQFVTLTISANAAFGQAGHFNEDGTPRAGHEQDYLGACIEEETTTTAAPVTTTTGAVTTTTVEATTTTTVPVTTTTSPDPLIPTPIPEESTTTTSAPEATTTTVELTTTTALDIPGPPVTVTTRANVASPRPELPRTGVSTHGLAVLASVLATLGLVAVRAAGKDA